MIVTIAPDRYKRAERLQTFNIDHDPADIADQSPAAARRVIQALDGAISQMNRLSASGHWAYNINIHSGLLEIRKAEQARIERMEALVQRLSRIGGLMIRSIHRPSREIPAMLLNCGALASAQLTETMNQI